MHTGNKHLLMTVVKEFHRLAGEGADGLSPFYEAGDLVSPAELHDDAAVRMHQVRKNAARHPLLTLQD